jgi:hypothetical protein
VARQSVGKWFRISFAQNAFVRFLAAHETTLEQLDAETAITLMTNFHANHRAQHTSHGGVDELRLSRELDPPTVTITRHMVRTDPELARDLVLRIAEQNTLELRESTF